MYTVSGGQDIVMEAVVNGTVVIVERWTTA